MKASWGELIYWVATIVAGLIAAFVAWDYVYKRLEHYGRGLLVKLKTQTALGEKWILLDE